MLEPEVEARPWVEQLAANDEAYRAQLSYLFERSAFYRDKLGAAGIASLPEAGGLGEIARLPLTGKAELKERCTPESPIGAHLCAEPAELVRIYSTSGTTGEPSYIPLTADDLENWVAGSARSYGASGVQPGHAIVSTYGAGPFVAGAALEAFERIGLRHVPVGAGNTERVLRAIKRLSPAAVALTPSYAAHLVEVAAERGVDLPDSSVEHLLVAGEPGGGEPAFRTALERGWGAQVTEAMGVGDIGPSLFGECPERAGMHLGARDVVHMELIDPESGEAIEIADGVRGELVLTHLRHRAAPLLRFRTRDHVEVRNAPCPCGRTDDMLIVRGVNVFPSAVREVVGEFAPAVSGHIAIRPRAGGAKQEPPLPVAVELARDRSAEPGLAEAIGGRLREVLVFRAEVELVPWGTLGRSDYKARLVER